MDGLDGLDQHNRLPALEGDPIRARTHKLCTITYTPSLLPPFFWGPFSLSLSLSLCVCVCVDSSSQALRALSLSAHLVCVCVSSCE